MPNKAVNRIGWWLDSRLMCLCFHVTLALGVRYEGVSLATWCPSQPPSVNGQLAEVASIRAVADSFELKEVSSRTRHLGACPSARSWTWWSNRRGFRIHPLEKTLFLTSCEGPSAEALKITRLAKFESLPVGRSETNALRNCYRVNTGERSRDRSHFFGWGWRMASG